MALQTFSFSQIVTNFATAVQGAAAALLDFGVGSVLRAIAQATAGVVLWLQGIVLQVLTLTRAATSNGADLDSFYADFGFERLSADSATGQATFSRFTATQQALIAIGTTLQTADGTQNFVVTLDTANGAYSPTAGAYVILANTNSVTLPVQAAVAGSGGNIQSNTLTVITTPIPGVDTVTNASAFANGIDAESDPASRVRFVQYLASLSKATKTAVAYAINSVQQGLDYSLTENADYNGTLDYGYFYVVIDDGTGTPSDNLVSTVSNAIDATRGFTIRFGVFKPSVLTANVAMTITSASGYTHATVVANVTAALRAFINGLAIGVTLPYTQLAGIAYEIAGVTNATGILLNSDTSDISATAKQKVVAGTISVA